MHGGDRKLARLQSVFYHTRVEAYRRIPQFVSVVKTFRLLFHQYGSRFAFSLLRADHALVVRAFCLG